MTGPTSAQPLQIAAAAVLPLLALGRSRKRVSVLLGVLASTKQNAPVLMVLEC